MSRIGSTSKFLFQLVVFLRWLNFFISILISKPKWIKKPLWIGLANLTKLFRFGSCFLWTLPCTVLCMITQFNGIFCCKISSTLSIKATFLNLMSFCAMKLYELSAWLSFCRSKTTGYESMRLLACNIFYIIKKKIILHFHKIRKLYIERS